MSMVDKVELFEFSQGLKKMMEISIDGAKFAIKEAEHNGVKIFYLYVFNRRTKEETLVAYCQSEELLNLYLDEKINLINRTLNSPFQDDPTTIPDHLLESWIKKYL